MKTILQIAEEEGALIQNRMITSWHEQGLERFAARIRAEQKALDAKICDSLANRDYCIDVRIAADAIRNSKD